MMMKKLLASSAAAALGLALVTATPASANLLVNGGFEGAPITSGPGPFTGRWEPFGAAGPFLPSLAATGSVMPLSGANHLELVIDNFPNAFAGAFQDVLVSAGDTVTFSGWAKDLGIDAGGTEIRMEFRDSVADIEIARTGNLVPALTSAYTPWSITDVVPAGADSVRAVYAIQSFGAGPNQIVYVDDISFVPEPASMALLGLGGLAMLRRR